MIELNFTKADLLRAPGIGRRTAEAVQDFLLEQGYIFEIRDDREIDKAAAILKKYGYKVELPNGRGKPTAVGGSA